MKKILYLSAVLGGLFCTATSSIAQTWVTNGAPPSTYVSIAASADGTKLIAGGASVFLSTNSGATWTTNNLPTQCLVTISADGTKMVGVGIVGTIVVSSNSGTTWSTNGSLANASSLAASADGSKLIALNTSSGGTISTNYGLTWKSFTAPGNKVAMSADGTKSYFLANNSTNVFASATLGITSNRLASPGMTLTALAVSADGKRLIGAGSTAIVISTNFGTGWTPTVSPIPPTMVWRFVTSSADGSRLMGAARGSPANGPIYTSLDFGNTWVTNDIVINLWSGVASSADGGELLAVNPNNIYMSKSTVAPLISAAASNNLSLSWGVPSTNFVLQQSLDFTSWSAVTNAPVLNFTNLQYQVSLASSNSGGFFRLISQ